MTTELPITIGNSANMPEANEPMLKLAVVTTATTMATASARSGISNGVRRNLHRPCSGAIAPAQRDGNGEHHDVERDAPSGVQSTVRKRGRGREPHHERDAEATNQAVALRQHRVGRRRRSRRRASMATLPTALAAMKLRRMLDARE